MAAGHRVCFACCWVARRLGLPLATVFPVRLCPLPSPLYAVLMGYKEAPLREARRRFSPLVRALFDDFLAVHAPCLAATAGGPIQVVLPVPSTARPGGSPLAGLAGLDRVARQRLGGARWAPEVLVRGAGAVGHMRPDSSAFAVPVPQRHQCAGRRVLLLDDTYVSGARSQSAAATLRVAGARAVVVVALGRVLRPDRSASHAAFLDRHRAGARVGIGACEEGFEPCCRCVQTPASTE